MTQLISSLSTVLHRFLFVLCKNKSMSALLHSVYTLKVAASVKLLSSSGDVPILHMLVTVIGQFASRNLTIPFALKSEVIFQESYINLLILSHYRRKITMLEVINVFLVKIRDS